MSYAAHSKKVSLEQGSNKMQSPFASGNEREIPIARRRLVGEGQQPDKMQGHWVLARAGKRVLRPGGIELTKRMLDALASGTQDRVVEFAPGLGLTARMVLAKHPLAYCGVEREPAAAEHLRRELAETNAQFVLGHAEESGLPRASANIVYGEAMLSMQSHEQKSRIFDEAVRLLTAGGRYGIHELCLTPDNISGSLRHEIQAAMSKEIHVGVQPLTIAEWVNLFEQYNLSVTWRSTAPMHLLEVRRVLQDEGFKGSWRIAFRVGMNPVLRRRLFAMRRLFRKYGEHLEAVSLIGQREIKNA